MSSQYKTRHGIDYWPAQMSDINIDIKYGKEWRKLKARGHDIKDPWVPFIDAMRKLFGDAFVVSKWTEDHVHDWVMYDKPIYWGGASCGKSNDVGACAVVDWITDPYDTITLIGSTTKDALRIRIWEAIERYHATAVEFGRQNGFLVPGKITQTGYALLNDRQTDTNPVAQGSKAGIHGVALNEGGKLQGAHLPYVRVIIDEIATIHNHDEILTTLINLGVSDDFKFAAMANPESWTDPSSSIYCTPVGGVDAVTVESREWMSTFGAHVRHDDGLKSPCVLDPQLVAKYPFLTSKKHIDNALLMANGDENSPAFWKMVRGFPTPVATGTPTVLDPALANRLNLSDPAPPFTHAGWVGTAAGIDPAWSGGGDNACYARCYVRTDVFGKPYLDFTGGVKRLSIDATSGKPAVQQIREQVLKIVNSSAYSAPFRNTAVDASANQGLADDLYIYAGADCLPVNNSKRASDTPIRAGRDMRKICETIYDRGTEAWCVLAEFCKAGMVKGLPAEVVRALTTRRYALKQGKQGVELGLMYPLRMEKKELFKKRRSSGGGSGYGHSPDECDACALAALAVKERMGLMPFGYVTDNISDMSVHGGAAKNQVFRKVEDFSASFDDRNDMGGDPLD